MADDAPLNFSSKAPKPTHVPDALVYDFDLLADPALKLDPHAVFEKVQRDAPAIFWTPRNGGHWMLNRYKYTFEASRDWEAFSSALAPGAESNAILAKMPPGARIPQPVPIVLDPPEHARFRMPLNGLFSPKAMSELQDDVRKLAVELVDRVAAAGRCEFMSAIAEPLPVQVFLKFMGLPLDHQIEYRALVRKQLSSSPGDTEATARILQEIASCMRETLLERRARPQNDLISRLWEIELDGNPITLEDMENYGVLLFTAGLDTVMNSLGFGVQYMAADQALQDRLRSHPELIPDAVEELLRRFSFLQGVRRLTRDLEFHGVEMQRGERVMLNLVGAHLDPRHWPNPTQVDLDRIDKAHITFSAGPHRCVGSHLARIELRTLHEVFLGRIPRFRLDPKKPPTFHGGLVLGVDTVDLIWDA